VEAGDGEFMEAHIIALVESARGGIAMEIGKGIPATHFVPGQGTLPSNHPLFNPRAAPSAQQVPMSYGAVFAAGALVIGVLGDLAIELGHESLKRRELGALASDILRDGLELEPQPLGVGFPSPPKVALKKKQKGSDKRYRIFGYGR
jgi:hypothetical protein